MTNDPDMDVAASAAFLRAALPAADLDEGQLEAIVANVRAERVPTGTTILRQGGAPAESLYVIHTGNVEVRVDGRLVDLPGAGEIFGELSLLTGAPPTATIRAGDDLELWMIDRVSAGRVLGTGEGIAFVQASLRRGMTQALDRDGQSLLAEIANADDTEGAVAAARHLPAGVCELVEGGSDAAKVGRTIGASVDALTSRLLAFAEEDLGPAPAPWAWLALGSEARLEQALHTDQDHALAFDPEGADPAELDPHFSALAERVTAGLESAGIPRCDGDAMAIHPGLRRPLDSWRAVIVEWMADPGVDGSILSSIVFDHRQIGGSLEAEPALHEVIARAPGRYPQFIRHLTRRSLDRKPPTGFMRNLVVESKGEHAGRLDIKHGGVTIVSNIARAYEIAGAGTQTGTLDRLRAAEARGQLDAERRLALEEAFRLLWQIRLEHQVAQVRRDEAPDDFVDPATLGPIARRGLKEAFKIVSDEQQMLAADLGVSV